MFSKLNQAKNFKKNKSQYGLLLSDIDNKNNNNLMGQTKFSFDQKTLVKIAKGAAIAGTGAVALYVLDWLGKIEVGAWTPVISMVVPILVNSVKEWMKGDNL